MARRLRAGAALLCVAALAAGCGVARVGARAGRAPAKLANVASAGRSVTAKRGSSDPHKEAAIRDAAAIFASFRPPPGARRSAVLPRGANSDLAQPPEGPAVGTVDDHGWWIVRGAPQAVLARVARRMPGRFSASGQGSMSQWGVAEAWWDVFGLPPVHEVLTSRELLVEVGAAAGGRTVIRVDAQVAWLPSKQATARVPAGARVLTVTAGYVAFTGTRGGRATPVASPRQVVAGPVTLTGPAEVGRIVGLVDRLSVAPQGTMSCPIDFGKSMWLVFRARPGGPALARVVADGMGCGGVTLIVRGRLQQPLSGGTALVNGVESVLGVRWKGLAFGS